MKIALQIISSAVLLSALSAAGAIDVLVDPSVKVGPVKVMNAVNNGPQKPRESDQTCGNFAAFRAARIPYGRTHDSVDEATSLGRTVDISAVFPNFDADENDPGNYDFVYTDEFLKILRAAGTEPFFRLGQTIENGIDKRHTKPPKDFAKWARICEHVVAHYTEGWANGFKWKIDYWEIWNEADAQPDENREKSAQWGGTKAQFFAFYETAAKHLKARFPRLRIGGPALGFRMDWAHDFIKYQKEHGTPMDFFSWHVYGGGIGRMRSQGREIRKMLDENGYGRAESILDEWNYIKGWTQEYPYSRRSMNAPKGAAFTAAMMASAQDEPVDMLMYYDARTATCYNGLFDFYSFAPRHAYYAFTAWADLRELGTQVKSAVSGRFANDIVAATAARNDHGAFGLLLARFCDDNNRTASEEVTVRLPEAWRFAPKVRAFLTDEFHLGSVFPLTPEPDGTLKFPLEPNAFIQVEAVVAGEAPRLDALRASRKLVWSDEFDGADLDRTKWRFRKSMNSDDCLYANDARTYEVRNSKLCLHVRPSPDPAKRCLLPYGVATHETMAFKYGYLEMRAKVPFRHGAWPSFWMQVPKRHQKCAWMSEVDIFEVFSSTNALSANLHKWRWDSQTKKSEHVMLPGGEGVTQVSRCYRFPDAEKLNGEFHVYGFEWTPQAMSFFVDGLRYCTIPIDEQHDYAPKPLKGMAGHHEFHSVIFNNEVFTPGHGWMPSGAELKPEDLPIDYEIDWIRLWQGEGEEIRTPA